MNDSGQSVVEVVALAPVVLVCGLLGLQTLVAGANVVAADHAAHAGALAKQLGQDPEAAARNAIPGWSRGEVRVRMRGDELIVRLKPRSIVPGFSGLLQIGASARAIA